MRVLMRTIAASPERMLDKGKSYNLPTDIAQRYIAAGFAETAAPEAKIERLPTQPDPEDMPEVDDDDDVTDD